MRNSRFDSNSFFNNLNGVPRGHFSQNQFGGTIGGPIIRNKTFFFFDAQDFTSRKATSICLTGPDASHAGRQLHGAETHARRTDGRGSDQLHHRQHHRRFLHRSCGRETPGPVSGSERPVAGGAAGHPRKLDRRIELPVPVWVPNDTYSYDVRVDHNLNDNNRIFGRFSEFNVSRQDAPWTGNPLAGNGNFATQYQITGKSLALSWTDVISSGMVNEIRAGFTRDNAHSLPIGVTREPRRPRSSA